MIDYHVYNAKNGYGLSFDQLKYWANRHKQAVKKNDTKTVDWIENMLTDINYHSECSFFHKGLFEEAINKFQED